jgi:acetyl-CoA C-acetyltransferase
MNTVIGYYTTQYGELWKKSLFDLVDDALKGVMKMTELEKEEVDAIFFGNMLGGITDNTVLSGGHIAEKLDLHVPVYRTEGACASGGLAFHLAHQYLSAHTDKTVLVLGAEKMNDVSVQQITTALASAASIDEQDAGLTFPGLYAMMAQVYMQQYSYAEEHLAYVGVKNHYHGSFNTKAHFRRHITHEQVMTSPYVANPLKMLDCSPISDGASAVVVTNKKSRAKPGASVPIRASEVATDSVSLAKRKRLDGLEATQIAAEKAFQTAQATPYDVSVAELHDCFSIAEIMAMEDIGFWKKGEGGSRISTLETQLGNGGDLVVNTSGGLKAAGHPVGATGIKQIGELYLQLTGQADSRQVNNPRLGLAHNVGGSGGVSVVTLLGEAD